MFFHSIRDALAFDDLISSKGAGVALTLDGVPARQLDCNRADFPIRIFPLGVSQTAAAGHLNLNGYFAVTLSYPVLPRLSARADVFLALADRIVSTLHRSRHDGLSVLFSKSIIAHSSFSLQNSNRRLRVSVGDNEIVQVLFFWTSPLELSDLAAASAASSSSADSSSKSPVTTVSSSPSADALAAVAASSELFP